MTQFWISSVNKIKKIRWPIHTWQQWYLQFCCIEILRSDKWRITDLSRWGVNQKDELQKGKTGWKYHLQKGPSNLLSQSIRPIQFIIPSILTKSSCSWTRWSGGWKKGAGLVARWAFPLWLLLFSTSLNLNVWSGTYTYIANKNFSALPTWPAAPAQQP